jgi:hypothetical protein
MKVRFRRPFAGLVIVLAAVLLAAPPARGASERVVLATGLVADYFTRTVTWEGDENPSKMSGPVLSVRQDFRFRDGLSVSLSAGLSLSDFDGLVFRGLPISLEYGSGSMRGVAVGAEVRARLAKSGDFEIKGVGRVVSSFGLGRTWPLEGFAVPGETTGRVNWTEASVGPEVSYLFFGKFVPSLEVFVRGLWADFKMDQTLEELTGSETKRVKADIAIGVSLNGEVAVSERLTLTVRGGILPYPGGVDALGSAGIRYRF